MEQRRERPLIAEDGNRLWAAPPSPTSWPIPELSRCPPEKPGPAGEVTDIGVSQ